MSDVSVERLTLRLSGYTEEQGRALAGLVGEALAGLVLPRAGRLDSIDLNLPREPAESEGALSRRIAGGVAAELARAFR